MDDEDAIGRCSVGEATYPDRLWVVHNIIENRGMPLDYLPSDGRKCMLIATSRWSLKGRI